METQTANLSDAEEQLIELLARCALRDQNALRLLYEQLAGKLNGIALRIVGSKDVAEDVLQISFTQIWEDAKNYRPDIARPVTWMTSIVRHRALDRMKADRRRQRIIDESVELETQALVSRDKGPMEHFMLSESNAGLSACMEQLSGVQQRALMLAYYYGLSREEIAAELESRIGTVKSWLHRGLQRLEQCLAQ